MTNDNKYPKKKIKCELFNDHFENAKRYQIPKAQLIIADLPYNLGNKAYASNPSWYVGGDNANGESELAGKQFFDTDDDFKINNFFDFCTRYLKKEDTSRSAKGRSSDSPAMIIFCSFEQMHMVIEEGKKHGLMHAYPLVFIKNFSAQVLKANMKIVGMQPLLAHVNMQLYCTVISYLNSEIQMRTEKVTWYLIGSHGKKTGMTLPRSTLHRSL